MKILVVHEADYINKVVFEYQIIPEILSSRGHEVYVVDFPVSWKKESLLDFGSLRTEYLYNIKKSNKSKGVTLIRPGFIKLPVLDRLSAFFVYFFLFRKIMRQYEIDAIMLYSAPNNGLQTLYWANRYRIPVLFRLLDVLHQLVPRKILKYPTRQIERIIYRRVDEIDAITPVLADYAVRMGGINDRTYYVPTASDSDLFYPQKKDSTLIKRYKISTKDIVVLFSGYLYNFSGLDEVVKCFGQSRKKYPNLKFLIVGDGTQKKRLEDIIKKYGLQSRVILTGFINYKELPAYINLADVCINPFHINETTDIIFPSKIYQYLACGKPTIATRLKGVLDIFPDKGGKHGIHYFNLKKPEELLDLALKINNKKIEGINPSLQDISGKLEKKLLKLVRDAKLVQFNNRKALSSTEPRNYWVHKQFIKYIVIGGLSLSIDFVVYFLLTRTTELFHLNLIAAKVISFLVSSIFNFNFNKRWTFEKKTSHNFAEITKYYSVALTSLVVNALLMSGFIKVFMDLVAWFMAAIVTVSFNFVLTRSWVFSDKKAAGSSSSQKT